MPHTHDLVERHLRPPAPLSNSRQELTSNVVCRKCHLLLAPPSLSQVSGPPLVQDFRLALVLPYSQGRPPHLDLAVPPDIWARVPLPSRWLTVQLSQSEPRRLRDKEKRKQRDLL